MPRQPRLVGRLQNHRQRVEELIDLTLGDDEWWGHRDDIASLANKQVVLKCFHEPVVGAFRWFAGCGIEFDCPDEADVANIDDVRQAFQGVQPLFPIRRKFHGAREQAFIMVGIESADRRRASHWVGRVGIAVEEINDVLRPSHKSIVDFGGNEHATHWDGAVCDAFGGCDDVRRDAEVIGAERRAEPSEGGDDFVENK